MGLRRSAEAVRLVSAVALLAALGCPGEGGSPAGAAWPHFHGPRRDNISTETGLLKEWPKGGPPLIWKFSECGRGYAGMAIAEGRIFTAGDFGPKEMLLALDLDGKLLWKAQNGKSWRGPYPGSRATPTCDHGVLYHLNPMGRLAAFEAKSGKEIWSVDLTKEFGARYGTWAMAENVVIDGDRVLCVPGGRRGRVVALDKASGGRLWATTEIADGAAYCSPLVVTHNGVRQMITLMQKSVVSVEVPTGRLLWTHKHATAHDQNVTMPIYRDGRLFVSSGHGTGGRLLQLGPRSTSVRELWLNRDLDNCHGGVILLGGHFYGSGCRLYHKGLVCVAFASGKTMWNHRGLGTVSLTCADGMLYCLDRRGRLSLVEASPQRCRIASQFQLPRESRDLFLCHPVVCGGRLYVRHAQSLFAYDVRAASRE